MTIDPSTSINMTAYAFTDSSRPNQSYYNTGLYGAVHAGAQAGSTNRAYFQFPVGGLAGTTITTATLSAYQSWAAYRPVGVCDATSGRVMQAWATAAFTSSSVTWNNSPAFQSYVASNSAVWGNTGCANRYADFPATSAVQTWASNNVQAGTMGLKAANEGDTTSYKEFNVANYPAYLAVDYTAAGCELVVNIQVCEQVRTKYDSLGGPGGILGNPTGQYSTAPDGRGRFQYFQNGAIYWSPETGAHAIYGAILSKWANLGWETSALGYPATDELGTPDGLGRFNHFYKLGDASTFSTDGLTETGSIYWTGSTGANYVVDQARATWGSAGWESGLGYPRQDPAGGLRANGRGWFFHPLYGGACGDAAVYQSDETGQNAYWLRCAQLQEWAAVSSENGPLGYPRTNEANIPNRTGTGTFFVGHLDNNGVNDANDNIYWSPATGAHATYATFADKWVALGYETGLGLPTQDLQNATTGPAGTFQHFESGLITNASGAGTHYVQGAIQSRYESLGGSTSSLAWPTDDPHPAYLGTQVDFQGGLVYSNDSLGQAYARLTVCKADARTSVPADRQAYRAVCGTGKRGSYQYQTYGLTDRLQLQVNFGTGNLLASMNAMTIPGRLSDTGLGLAYNSLTLPGGTPTQGTPGGPTRGGAGWGWNFSSAPTVQVVPNTNDGAVTEYAESGDPVVFAANGSGGYKQPPGTNEDLVKDDTTFGSGGYKLTRHASQDSYFFDASGALRQVLDRNQNPIRFGYSTGGALSSIDGSRGDAGARRVNVTVTGGRVTQTWQTPTGGTTRAVAYKYGTSAGGYPAGVLCAAGDLCEVDDLTAAATVLGYDDQHRLTYLRDPLGHVAAVGYDAYGRVSSVARDPGGANATTRYDYSTTYTRADGKKVSETRVTDPNAAVATDSRRQVITKYARVTDPATGPGSDLTGERYKVNSVYDGYNRMTSDKTYTPNNGVSTSTNAGGGMTKNCYTDSHGGSEDCSGTSAGGGSGQDANGPENMTRTTSAAGATGSATYNSSTSGTQFLPSSGKDASGNSSNYSYDGNGNLSSTTQTDGGSSNNQAYVQRNTTSGSSNDGTVAFATDPLNKGKGTTRSSKCVRPDNTVDNCTDYQRNAQGELTTVVPPDSSGLGPRTYGYDGFSRTSSFTSGNNVTTYYGYDNLDRPTGQSYSDSTPAVALGYDVDGNTTSRTDGQARTCYYYDALNRLTGKAVIGRATPCPAAPAPTDQASTYAYDAAGNLTASADSRGTIGYHYSAIGLLDQMTEANGRRERFAYDTDHRRTDTWFNVTGANTSPDPQTDYDTSNNLMPPSSFAAHQKNRYDKAGKLQRVTGYGNGDSSRYTDFCYSYYANPTSNACLDVDGASSPANGSSSTNRVTRRTNALSSVSTAYGYDYAGRLLAATASTGTSYAYTYDADGNRTSQTAGSTVTDYGYNSGNQLCWTRARGLLPEPAHTCPPPLLATASSYDSDGNQRQPGNLGYNGSDQTTSFNGPLAAYLGPDQSERYSLGSTVYNTSMLGLTNSKTGSAGTLTFDRASDGTLIALHIPATGNTPAKDYYYLTDNLGSVVALIDPSSTKGVGYTYDPYGAITATTGPDSTAASTNPFRYTGAEYDATSGLLHLGKRYYDPTLGRFTQQDSIEALGSPSRGNRYAYAGGDPVNKFDPTGRLSQEAGNAIGGTISFEAGGLFLEGAGVAAEVGAVAAVGVLGVFGIVGVAVGVALFEGLFD